MLLRPGARGEIMSALRRTPGSGSTGSVLKMVLALLAVGCGVQACANPGIEGAGELNEMPSAESIVKRYVEAVGGREALLNLGTRVADVRVVTHLEWDHPDNHVTIHEVDTLSVYGTSSGEFLIVTRGQDGTTLEGSDGGEQWRIDPNNVVSDVESSGTHHRWMTDPQFPLKLLHYFPDMKVLGTDVWGTDFGGRDRIFVVETDGDESHRLGFDVETGLLTRMGYNCEIRDYRGVDGVLMPMQVAFSRKGGNSTYFLESVEHNVKMDPTMFSLAK